MIWLGKLVKQCTSDITVILLCGILQVPHISAIWRHVGEGVVISHSGLCFASVIMLYAKLCSEAHFIDSVWYLVPFTCLQHKTSSVLLLINSTNVQFWLTKLNQICIFWNYVILYSMWLEWKGMHSVLFHRVHDTLCIVQYNALQRAIICDHLCHFLLTL